MVAGEGAADVWRFMGWLLVGWLGGGCFQREEEYVGEQREEPDERRSGGKMGWITMRSLLWG
ncbi:hypothetical protein AT246_06480 [Bartonella henselae]|nr:hypothetical protein BhenCHDE101_07230 [Bartonella henselae]PNM38959.1 hypothetical protein AL470_006540 [Bartonella henselae str. Houston-1]OLL39301.1 hypothetical protein AT237_07555 [Bartonella henselae]OLL45484.1 hypothetical protein AT242_07645 [Bartonella henselae]OLL52710.1 hypothetical protein AT238_07845 [Bartonella henselae]